MPRASWLARGARAVLVLLTVLAADIDIASAASANAGRVMLPDTVTPEHYRIDIVPDPHALTFRGQVQIDVIVHRPTPEIVLNAADIVIERARLSGTDAVRSIHPDDRRQTVTFTLARPLPVGPYTLSLDYHGKIYRQASGLFALDYSTPHGPARALFTQFENADARRFVPCWDEPARKATFELTATVAADTMAVSNMPVAAEEQLGSARKRVHFAATPKMSSYLLFFAAGDFERVHRQVGDVDVGVIVKRGDTGSTAFALDVASQILPYYDEYFGIPYPLPKLDLIAAPGASQFFGAMENWGAIFYFERDLLIDPRIANEHDRQNVYVVIAHEMAHQWFGNLVTMAWWDDLWLNEGFASWMENKVTQHFHPEWKIWLQSLDEKHSVMQEDARDGTHPIITPILDVLQASEAFDSITYIKGAAVIRMLEAYLGEVVFRAGVRRYMREHAYGNTVTDDLWHAVDAESPARPILAIAHDFTLQAGVPVVEQRGDQCEGGSREARLAQSHFAIDPESTSARIWRVPALLAPLGGTAVATVVVAPSESTARFPSCAPLVVNAGQTGYFRSRYTEQGLAALTAAYGSLSADDQLGLLNDRSAFAYAGVEPMSTVLGLTRHVPPNADPVVTSAFAGWLSGLDRLFDERPDQAAFRAYAIRVLEPSFARVTWEPTAGESFNVASLRATLIVTLGELGDPAVITEARRRFAAYVHDPKSVPVSTRHSLLTVVAAHADESTWDELHRLAQGASTELERREFYALLATPEDRALVDRALSLALSNEPAPTIAPEMISRAAVRHPRLAFDFAVAHWDRIALLLEPTSRARFVPRLLSHAWDPELIEALERFAAQHIPSEARQDVRKTVAQIRYRAAIRDKRLPQVDRWLESEAGTKGAAAGR